MGQGAEARDSCRGSKGCVNSKECSERGLSLRVYGIIKRWVRGRCVEKPCGTKLIVDGGWVEHCMSIE